MMLLWKIHKDDNIIMCIFRSEKEDDEDYYDITQWTTVVCRWGYKYAVGEGC